MNTLYTFFLLGLLSLIGRSGQEGMYTKHIPALSCSIEISAKNQSKLSVVIDISRAEVKVKQGGWGSLYQSARGQAQCGQEELMLKPGTRQTLVQCNSRLSCEYPRRYRFPARVIFPNGKIRETVIYYPDESSYTQQSSIELGEVGRFFR